MKREIDSSIAPGINKRYAQICQVYFDGDAHIFAEQCGLSLGTIEMLFEPREATTDFPTINRILLKVIPELSMRWLWFNEGKMAYQI